MKKILLICSALAMMLTTSASTLEKQLPRESGTDTRTCREAMWIISNIIRNLNNKFCSTII